MLPAYDAMIGPLHGMTGSGFGQTFQVYRLSAATPPAGILAGSPIGTLAAKLDPADKHSLENETFGLQVEVATGDVSALLKGDIIVTAPDAYKGDGAAFCFAQHRPPKAPVFPRLEFRGSLRRSVNAATRNALDQTPGAFTEVTALAEVTSESASILTLGAGGLFAFVDPALNPTRTIIPVGIQPTTRARPGRGDGIKAATNVERFLGYVPPLGVQLRENDVMDLDDSLGTSYLFEQVFSTGAVGLVGTIALLSKIGA